MFPLAATAAGSNPLHAVLTCMLSEMREESAKRTSVIVSDGNWRTRQVVRELKGVKSMAELFSTEDQVRSVVMSQETRCRVKLFNAFLVGQYIVEEQASVMEEEVQCRESLTLHALSVLHNEGGLCSLIGQEMCVRYSLVQAYMEERVIFRKSHEVEVLVLCEEKRRWVLAQMEHINRTEIERRRFLSVGREIGVELLRHNFYRFATWARFQSTHLMHDLALLVTEEERERCTLERLYLLKLSLIANDQENAAARLVVISVMRASLIRRKLQDDHWMRERASRVLALPSDESDKRCIIERKEMEEYQELRVSFLISWREVFKRAMKPDEGTAIVERLEIYERRCVFDQWRFGLNALDEWKDRERRVIVRRENACNVFFQTVIDSLTALWKQENYQFDRLRKQYSDFVWSHQMLQLTLVLEFEETAVRQKIVESEARDALNGRALLYVWQCEEAALREATSIMKMERDCRSALMEWHQKIVQDVCFKQLFNEEDLARIDIESEAREAWTKFVLEERSALCGGPCANALGSLEDTQRELLIREERQIFFYHKLRAMISLERRRRQVIRKAEFYHRVNVYASLLDDVERWNRLELQVEYQNNFLQILLREVEDHESIARVVMMKCEDERRHFLFGSFDYSLPYLRACEVDELNARLDIINEAELTIGALAYRWGMHSHVSLCAEELRLSQCALCFMSSRELLQHREVELVRVLEPVSRRDIIHREITDRLLVLMEAQEERGRIQIEKKAADAYNATQELFDRIISRADQWRTRGVLREPVVLSGREALINYFHRQESFMAIRLRANQEKTRDLLGSFFGGFYWGRDAIMVEEFVAREGIMDTFRQPHIPLRALDQTLGSKLTVRFYSLGMMMNDEVQSLFIKMYDSVDDVGVTYELHEAQSVVTAGRVFRVWFPAQLMKWVRPLTNESNVLYFEVRQKDGEVVASASLLLRGEELRRSTGAAATVLSLPSDDRRGKMNVVLYVH